MTARAPQVYLLHFDQPIGDTSKPTGYAQHYTGTAQDLAARLAEHRAAPDAKIMQAVRRKGIGWQLARTWEGGRQRERQLKNQGGARRHCPVCKGSEPQAVAAFRVESRPRWRKPQVPGPARDLDAVLLESVTARLDQDRAPAFLDTLRTAEREAWAAGADYRRPGYEGRFRVACDMSRLAADERDAAAQMERHRQAAVAEGWWPQVPRPREPEPDAAEVIAWEGSRDLAAELLARAALDKALERGAAAQVADRELEAS